MEDNIDNRIWDSVQTEPTYSSNPSDYVDHWKRFLDAELASLREQLKQKEEVIRELIPIADRYMTSLIEWELATPRSEAKELFSKKAKEVGAIIDKVKGHTVKCGL